MAIIEAIGSKTDTCPECGGIVDVTFYGGTNTTWGDEYDGYGYRTQHTDRLSEGFSAECRSCDYGDAQPCEA